jgi:cytidine deaminase
MSIEALFEAALLAQSRAYAPYSGFPVGAAALGGSGAVYAGCNVENAAYPVGTCAEAAAIAAMVAAGERRLTAILVVGDGKELVTPCGACRQRIREFGTADTPIHAAGRNGVRETFALGELLPRAFGPDNLPDR